MIGGPKSNGRLSKGKYTVKPRKRKYQEPPQREHKGYEEFKATEYLDGTLRKPDAVSVDRRGLPDGGESGRLMDAKRTAYAMRRDAREQATEERREKYASDPNYRAKLDAKVKRRLAAKASKRAA